MGEKTNSKSNKWIWYLVLLCIIIPVGIFFYLNWNDTDDLDRLSPIVVEDLGNGKKLVKNTKVGFEVVVGEEWAIKKDEDGFSAILPGKDQIDNTELFDSSEFRVFEYEKNNLEIEEWLKTKKIKNYLYDEKNNTYYTENKIKEESVDSFDLVEKENSLLISYFIEKDLFIVEAQCIGLGDNFEKKARDCVSKMIYSIR